MPDSDFTALLCSRLCHDLISPVGAITNGLEVLAEEDDDDMRKQVLAMLEQSANATSTRLKFYRLAFGSAGGFGAAVDVREAHKALSQYLEIAKVSLDWESSEEALDKRVLKLVLNLALIAAEAMIRGGTLAITISRRDHDCRIELVAKGDRFLLSDNARAAALGQLSDSELEPRTAPAHLVSRLAENLDTKIEIGEGANGTHVFAATIGLPLES